MLNNECILTRRPSTMQTVTRCGDNVIADINSATGTVIRTYVTPMLDDNVSMTIAGATPTTYYYNADERQSVMNLTDSTSAVVQSYGYSAYGDKVDTLTSGTVEQRYTYTGRELSDTSGDYYFRYRMYSAGTGSFMSRDPLGYMSSFGGIKYFGLTPRGVITKQSLGMSLYSGYFAKHQAYDPSGLLTFWIGGAADVGFPGWLGLMESVREQYWRQFGDPDGPGHSVGWSQTDSMLKMIEDLCKKRACDCKPKKPLVEVNLIGHSWGGATAMRLAQKLKNHECARVTVLVTLDPVWNFPLPDPKNYEYWVNVHQRQSGLDYALSIPYLNYILGLPLGLLGNDFPYGLPDVIGTWGGQLGRENGAVNVEVPYSHGNPWSMFEEALDMLDLWTTIEARLGILEYKPTHGKKCQD